jgi:hypothetical protein
MGLNVGVVCVQNETTAGRQRLGTGGPGVFGGHHTHAFAANNTYPSNINSFFGNMGSALPKIMYAALGPKEISTQDPWGPLNNESRLVDENACRTFADQCITYLNANSSILYANFWNEMKGYNWGNDATNRTLFNNHYIAWATRMKQNKPNFPLGGPYSTGGLSVSALQAIHTSFRDNVVIPHPELVDFIAWDHSGAEESTNGVPAHLFYTNIYTSVGIMLPHMDTEWYPGGWNTSTPPSVGNYARSLCRIATNPQMQWIMHWGGGSDPTMKTTLWNSSGTPTAYWTALNTVAAFTRHGGVTTINADSWSNANGQVLTVSGDAITVSGGQGSVPANAIFKKTGVATFTVNAVLSGDGPVWTNPADGAVHAASPTVTFIMPQSTSPMFFDLNVDTVNTFNTGNFRRYSSFTSQTNWQYWNGTAWVAHPSTGVPPQYSGNEARFTISDPLAAGTWYRRVRRG